MTAALENTSVLIVRFSATNFFDQACLSLDAPQRPGNEKGRRKRGALGGRSGCGAWIRTKDLRVMSRLEGAAVSDAPPQLYSKPSPAVVACCTFRRLQTD